MNTVPIISIFIYIKSRTLTKALRVRCAYAEYVLRTFRIRCIRSEYAARRLVIRYAKASHALNKHPGGLCESMRTYELL